MASPAKQAKEFRTESVRTSLTAAEKCFIREQAAAAGITDAEYLRRRALGEPVAHRSERLEKAAIVNELNRLAIQVNMLGNCVNQVARAVNSDRSFPDHWEELPYQIKELRRFVEAELERIVLSYGR